MSQEMSSGKEFPSEPDQKCTVRARTKNIKMMQKNKAGPGQKFIFLLHTERATFGIIVFP